MKKFLSLIFVIFIITGCSSARPVIRVNEMTPEKLESSSTSSESKLQSTGSSSVVQSIPESQLKGNETTKADQMISASDNNVTNLVPDSTRDQGSSTRSNNASKGTSGGSGGQLSGGKDSSKKPEPDEKDQILEDQVLPKVSRYNLFDYYPLIPNRLINYRSDGMGSSSTILQYLHEEPGKATAQIKQSSDSGSRLNVIRITQEKINDLYYTLEVPFRGNVIGWRDYEERTILMAPIQEGNQWVSTGLSFEIVAVDEPREINGEMMTVMDVRVSNQTETVLFTYAVGIGLVSNDFINPDGTLTNIVSFDGLKENVRDTYYFPLYFPKTGGGYELVSTKVDYMTNDATKDLMTLAYLEQAKAKGLIPVLEDKTKIQFLYLNQDIVQVDLNDSFITQQNDSPELENARIQSLVNTLCQYYQAKGVQLTINDQRYESNQRKIEPTEVLTPVH